MRLFVQDPGILGAFATFLAFSTLTTLPRLVSAAPKQPTTKPLTPRARENDPGLGVELEISSIRIKTNVAGTRTREDWEDLKGKTIIPKGFTGDPKTNWEVTAETYQGPENFMIYPEAIVDGTEYKLGSLQTKSIGAEIVKYFVSRYHLDYPNSFPTNTSVLQKDWDPSRSKNLEVDVEGMERFNPWKVEWEIDGREFFESHSRVR